MDATPQLPTPEQYNALREFVTTRERELELERRRTGPGGTEANGMLASWSRTVWKYINLINSAMKLGEQEEAAQAWTVLLDLFQPWVDSPKLPPSLRGPVAAATRTRPASGR